LEKGGEGGFEKADRDIEDTELFILYEISPDPSLLKRGKLNRHLSSLLFPPHYSL
jgi:hypothetical protein